MADFTIIPDFVFTEEPRFSTIISEFENGAEQRRSRWSSSLRRWRLVFKTRAKAEFEAVKEFFINKRGAYESFTWINPNDNTEYNVRFEEDSIEFKNIAPNFYDFECVFVEVK